MSNLNIILLTSAENVKAYLPISENLGENFLLAGIREAQDFRLVKTIGSRLLASLKTKVAGNTIDNAGNEAYASLLYHYVQPFLAYEAVGGAIVATSYKLANMGVIQTNDEKVIAQGREQVELQKHEQTIKADAILADMQRWLNANRAAFPELGQCSTGDIPANLGTRENCGLWLGGDYGRKTL